MLNKPAGVLTQKAKPEDFSLNEWLIGHLLAADAIKETDLATFHPSVCNRLDRNTSGIVLCGKTLAGSQALSRIIKDRSVKKYYQTVCKGKILQESTLEGYLYKDGSGTPSGKMPLRRRCATASTAIPAASSLPLRMPRHCGSSTRRYGTGNWTSATSALPQAGRKSRKAGWSAFC